MDRLESRMTGWKASWQVRKPVQHCRATRLKRPPAQGSRERIRVGCPLLGLLCVGWENLTKTGKTPEFELHYQDAYRSPYSLDGTQW